MVEVSEEDSWTSPSGGVLGSSSQEETIGQTQRLHFSSGLGMHQRLAACSVDGGSGRGEDCLELMLPSSSPPSILMHVVHTDLIKTGDYVTTYSQMLKYQV